MTKVQPQSKSSGPGRARIRISPKLEKQLGTYLTAASAAGVGLLAASTPAQAKVVYKSANITVPYDTAVSVDLNGDGVADVTFGVFPGDKSFQMVTLARTGDEVRLTGVGGDVAAGFFGVPVGPGEAFGGATYQVMYVKVFGYGNASCYGAFGPWANVSNRYLGVKFVISGTTHYGWVRITTSISADPLITGYAYETTPNTSIKCGAISGPTKVASMLSPDQPISDAQPTLGLLARGAEGMAIWRRDEQEANLVA